MNIIQRYWSNNNGSIGNSNRSCTFNKVLYFCMQIVLMLESCLCHNSTSLLSLFIHQIQDARNHVNQALQLLSSHDESYHFKTGAEVNKVCPLRPHGKNMDDVPVPDCSSDTVSVTAVAHGCSDAPADTSTQPPHHPGLHDTTWAGHQWSDGTGHKMVHTTQTLFEHTEDKCVTNNGCLR